MFRSQGLVFKVQGFRAKGLAFEAEGLGKVQTSHKGLGPLPLVSKDLGDGKEIGIHCIVQGLVFPDCTNPQVINL